MVALTNWVSLRRVRRRLNRSLRLLAGAGRIGNHRGIMTPGDLFTTEVLALLGGIGMILFGMQTMTAALKELAGGSARAALARFTRTPLTGVATGAVATAVVQSSHATTLMTIGFVGAGMLSFPQALGILFGANIGTTATGWIVVLVGFKLQLGVVALPLLFAASLLAVLGGAQWARLGRGVAGFALLFIGIDAMQAGMAGFEGRLTPGDLPGAGWLARLQLLGLGIAITVLTQSSSAGMAAALVLLGAGTLSFDQAAAIVIGMNIGSTTTAVMASIGGSVAMRQAALANLLFNIVTGALAFLLLDLLVPLLRDNVLFPDDQTALVLFHTGFNLIGTALFLPFARPYARAIQWLVPDRDRALADRLDPALLDDPGSAITAAATTARAVTEELFIALGDALRPGGTLGALPRSRARAEAAVDALDAYLARIVVPADKAEMLARYGALLHQFDHLHRLTHRAGQQGRILHAMQEARLARPARLLGGLLRRAAARPDEAAKISDRLDRLERRLARIEDRLRVQAIGQAAARGLATARVFALTDSIRWLRRTTAHADRILHYQALAQ